mgnify:CR=1 FL=1
MQSLSQLDTELANARSGVYTFRVNGVVHHSIASSMVPSCHDPGFAQIYICDSDQQVNIRTSLNGGLDNHIIQQLQDMIFNVNPLARLYRRAAEQLQNVPDDDFVIALHSDRSPSRGHRGQFLLPASGEIAAVVPTYSSTAYRDIIIQRHGQGLLHIDELHPLYDPLHYVLMFPRGEQGWCAPVQGKYPFVSILFMTLLNLLRNCFL